MRKLLLITPIFLVFTSCKIIKGIKDSKRSNETIVKTTIPDAYTLPFELENNKIIVKIKIAHDGTEDIAKLMLDTGAPTLLSEDFAKEHHMSFADSTTMRLSTPVAGEHNIKKYTAKDIGYDIAGISVVKPHLRIMPISKAVTECSHIDGILGVDILSQFNLVFDFRAKQILVYSKTTMPVDIKNFVHIIKFSNYSFLQKTPQVTLNVNGTEEDYIWDTGFNGGLYMRNNSQKSFNKWLKAHPESKRYQTFGATTDISGRSAATINYYFITDTILNKKELLSTHKLKASNMYNPEISVGRNNVGIGFMKNYRMLISWSNKKIYLQENVKPTASGAISPILAGYAPESGEVVIRVIAEESKAFGNGIRANDKVVAIDGKEVATLLKTGDRCAIDNTIAGMMQKAKQLEVVHAGKQQTVVIE